MSQQLGPEERIQRIAREEEKLRSYEKMCSTFTVHTPCACREIMTNAEFHKEDGKKVLVEYPEYICNNR